MTLPDGSRAAEVVRVPFHGTEIHTVLVNGEPHVVIRPTVDGMGLDASAQLKKLKTKSWATVAETATVAEDGRVRDMATVDLETWAMLLANIDENRVAPATKPLIVFYQKESAKALRKFWTQGGAISPAATDAQLDDLTDEIEVKRAARRALAAKLDLSVIEALGASVDPTWRESLARHAWAVYKGEASDIAPEDRMLMTEPYLIERGLSRADVAAVRSVFGKRVKAAYTAQYGREPEMTLGMVNGRERPVKGYYERDRFIFDAVFEKHYSHLAGPTQLELGAA